MYKYVGNDGVLSLVLKFTRIRITDVSYIDEALSYNHRQMVKNRRLTDTM